ncbi:MAG: YkgJ family cysteine cluster protein [Nanoarchaeota archaeon]|nr:YkgJ family cysteine cluster protein [Nanoarchaeota archaeon]
MKAEKCYRCGYCCKKYDATELIERIAWVKEQAEKAGVPKTGPCPHLEETAQGYYNCRIYNDPTKQRPVFCVDGPKFNPISKESLEEKLTEGKDLPKCLVAFRLGEEYLSKDLKH